MSLDSIIGQGGTIIIDPYESQFSPDDFLTKYGNIVDSVCIVAKSERGSTYYQSSTAPKDPNFGEIYSAFSQIATDIGLDTYALVHGNLDSFFSRDPNFQMHRSGGNPIQNYVCANQKIYWQYLSEITAEIAVKSGINGIIIKDIHYPRETSCFCDNCRMSFASDYDFNRDFAYDQISKSSKFSKWKETRVHAVRGLLSSVVQRVHQERKIEVYGELLLDPATSYFQGAEDHLGQSLINISQVTSNLAIHINPWSQLPNSQTDVDLFLENIAQRIDMLGAMNTSLFLWGPNETEFEMATKIRDAIGAQQIFFTEDKPRSYLERRSLHLDLGV